MREFDYCPKTEPFKGSVVLKVPSYKERIKLAQEMGVANMKVSGEAMDLGTSLELAGKLIDKMDDFIVSVDLKVGKQKFTSLEDLQYYSESQALVSELSGVVMKGITLGEN